jgi:hypothetical protein
MSYSFAGETNNCISMEGVAPIDTGPWTAGAWIYLTANPTGIIRLPFVSLTTSTGAGQVLGVVGNSGSLASWEVAQSGSASNSATTSTGVAVLNLWSFMAGTFDGTMSTTSCDIYRGDQDELMHSVTVSRGGSAGTRTTSASLGKVGGGGAVNSPASSVAQAFIVPWKMTLDELEQFRQGSWSVLYAHGKPRFFLPLTGASLYDMGGSA